MKIFRHIALVIAALHLVFATSGVPLAYMFCGEDFCSLSLATVSEVNQEQSCPSSNDCSKTSTKSCCDEDFSDASATDEMQCHTELHLVKLSVDALNASSMQAFNSLAPIVAIIAVTDFLAQTEQSRTLYNFSLDSSPPKLINRSILFRSLLI